MDETFLNVEAYCNDFRSSLGDIEIGIRSFVKDMKESNVSWDKWECIAQAMLALRHIEDARMRFGKCIQYSTDWISIYDK